MYEAKYLQSVLNHAGLEKLSKYTEEDIVATYLVALFARSNGELRHAHDLHPVQGQELGANGELRDLRGCDQLSKTYRFDRAELTSLSESYWDNVKQ